MTDVMKTGMQTVAAPPHGSLAVVEAACARCRACPLYLPATQAVFGEGPPRARLMMIGEQPGNDEDLAGHPFVGPAGALLDTALADAGVKRRDVYLTNAVKHFKFVVQGKRRLHEKPKSREIRACRPWLLEEVRLVRPRVVVTLGATAAGALFGPKVQVMRDRGRLLSLPTEGLDAHDLRTVLTIHPSAALRAPSSERRRELREMLVADLVVAWRALKSSA
jgi:uracil-DNA glycosylase family protein